MCFTKVGFYIMGFIIYPKFYEILFKDFNYSCWTEIIRFTDFILRYFRHELMDYKEKDIFKLMICWLHKDMVPQLKEISKIWFHNLRRYQRYGSTMRGISR